MPCIYNYDLVEAGGSLCGRDGAALAWWLSLRHVPCGTALAGGVWGWPLMFVIVYE